MAAWALDRGHHRRRRGGRSRVGSAVILAGLAEARTQGERLVILLGHLGYYPRFGFRPAADFGIDGPISGPHLMVLPLDDRPVRPGTIRYPVTWNL